MGVLVTDEERAQGPICGRWYLHLGRHVVETHALPCDEYRARFGLRLRHGLIGPALREPCR